MIDFSTDLVPLNGQNRYLITYRKEYDDKFPGLIDFILNAKLVNQNDESKQIDIYLSKFEGSKIHPNGYIILDGNLMIGSNDYYSTLLNGMMNLFRRRITECRWLLIYL